MTIANPDYTDIVNKDFQSRKVTVGGTQVLAVANVDGVTPLEDREKLLIENLGNQNVFIGPTGVTSSGSTQGRVLEKDDQFVFDRIGPDIGVYMITNGGNSDVIVWEFS